MAITKILKVKGNPKNVIDYITNEKKIQEKLLVSSLGCMIESAASSFNLALTNGDAIIFPNVVTGSISKTVVDFFAGKSEAELQKYIALCQQAEAFQKKE